MKILIWSAFYFHLWAWIAAGSPASIYLYPLTDLGDPPHFVKQCSFLMHPHFLYSVMDHFNIQSFKFNQILRFRFFNFFGKINISETEGCLKFSRERWDRGEKVQRDGTQERRNKTQSKTWKGVQSGQIVVGTNKSVSSHRNGDARISPKLFSTPQRRPLLNLPSGGNPRFTLSTLSV